MQHTKLSLLLKPTRKRIDTEKELKAHYSPKLFLRYLSILFLKLLILVALIASSGNIFHWSTTLFPKLNFKTSLCTLSLNNFIECPLVLVQLTLKKESSLIPSKPFNILKTSNTLALTLLVSTFQCCQS